MNTSVKETTNLTSVSQLKTGQSARVRSIDGDRHTSQRISVLGIRPGVDLRVVHGPGSRGAVVQVGGARIALDQNVTQIIWVEPTTATEQIITAQEARS